MRTKDENKVHQIYKASLKLIAETGIAGLSIAAIAKEVGIGTGSFYTYFKSKEELLNELYKETRKYGFKELFADHSPDEPVKVAMRKVLHNYLKYRLEHYEIGVFQDQYVTSPYMQDNEDVRQFSRKMAEPLFELFDRGKKELLLKNIDNVFHSMTLRGIVNEMALYMRLRHLQLTDKLVDIAFQLFWDAVRE
jgi:AcrR family transcriptional regulator